MSVFCIFISTKRRNFSDVCFLYIYIYKFFIYICFTYIITYVLYLLYIFLILDYSFSGSANILKVTVVNKTLCHKYKYYIDENVRQNFNIM